MLLVNTYLYKVSRYCRIASIAIAVLAAFRGMANSPEQVVGPVTISLLPSISIPLMLPNEFGHYSQCHFEHRLELVDLAYESNVYLSGFNTDIVIEEANVYKWRTPKGNSAIFRDKVPFLADGKGWLEVRTGRIQDINEIGGTSSFEYEDGLLVLESHNGKALHITRPDKRTVVVQAGAGENTSFLSYTWTGFGAIEGIKINGATVYTLAYDSSNRLISVFENRAGATQQIVQFSYSNNLIAAYKQTSGPSNHYRWSVPIWTEHYRPIGPIAPLLLEADSFNYSSTQNFNLLSVAWSDLLTRSHGRWTCEIEVK